MSTHTQQVPNASAVAGRDASFEKVLRMAVVIAEANERLFKLQSDAANAAFSENAKHLKSLLATKDSGSLLSEWAGLYQTNMRRVLDVSRIGFEIVPETQAKMAAVMGEPFNTYTKETQQYLDQYVKAIADGRDTAAAAVKQFLAKTMASVSGQQDAKKAKVS
ncbi:MAG: phasin family protein [Casimicrobiaceae bacterium]